MLVIVFVVIGTIFVLNLSAAGLVATAHIWKREWSHRRRVAVAALLSGALPIFALSGTVLGQIGSVRIGEIVGVSLGFGLAAAIFGGLALPLAIVVSRKLGDNRPVGDTFT